MEKNSMQNLDTMPKYLLRNFQNWGDRDIAVRKKKYGIWNEYTWKAHYEHTKYFGLGLVALGFQKKDMAAILGDADPEWNWAQMAIWSIGAVATGIFTDCLPIEVQYIAENSDSKFLIVSNQEQVDKGLEIKDNLPMLEKIIYWDKTGMRNYDDSVLIYFYDVVEMGRAFEEKNPDFFEERIAEGKGDDVAMIYYTSGTTGKPKGAVRTYKSLLHTMKAAFEIVPAEKGDDYVALAPPAWIAALMNEAGHLLKGLIVNYPEKTETVMEDLREISPVVNGGGPRIWEGMVSLIQAKINDAGMITRALYNLFLPVGYHVADLHLKGEKSPLGWNILYMIANRIVFRPLRDQLGFRKSKYYMTGSAALSPDTFRYFHAIGCPLRQGYASTEGGTVCGHYGDETNIRFDTIGKPNTGVKVRISTEGEIQIRSEGLFSEYHKNPDATKEAMEGGWFHTGDAGYITDEGHVVYTDRVSELGELANGGKYSPQYIEGSFRFSAYIQEAVSIGGKHREALTAILNIDYNNVGRWAEKRRINYTTYVDLSQKEEVADLIMNDVHRVNRVLPDKVKVKKFVILNKEIDPDDAEMTRSGKLKRKIFEDKYKDLIDGIYSDKTSVTVDAIVQYRDGKERKITTDLKIWKVEKL